MTILPFHSVIFKRGVWRVERAVMCEDLRFKHTFTCINSGPSGSGMSSFCIKMLQNLESMSTETRFEGGILWCYAESNAVPSVDVGRKIQFHESVPDNFAYAGNKPCLIILEYLLNEAYPCDCLVASRYASYSPALCSGYT